MTLINDIINKKILKYQENKFNGKYDWWNMIVAFSLVSKFVNEPIDNKLIKNLHLKALQKLDNKTINRFEKFKSDNSYLFLKFMQLEQQYSDSQIGIIEQEPMDVIGEFVYGI